MSPSKPQDDVAVRAFRDSFGDRKPPDISRKITACVACRKQKVAITSGFCGHDNELRLADQMSYEGRPVTMQSVRKARLAVYGKPELADASRRRCLVGLPCTIR